MEDSVTVLCSCLVVQDESLDKAGYEIVRNSILKHLLAYGAMTPEQLGAAVKNHLNRKLCGSLHRHYEAVRQTLEARGEIQWAPRSLPRLIEIAG